MNAHIRDRSGEGPFHVLQQVVAVPRQRLALLFSMLMFMGHFIIIPFINPYMEFNKGYSKVQTPMIYLVGGISSFIAANILGRYADKRGKLPVFIVCTLLSFGIDIAHHQSPCFEFRYCTEFLRRLVCA